MRLNEREKKKISNVGISSSSLLGRTNDVIQWNKFKKMSNKNEKFA